MPIHAPTVSPSASETILTVRLSSTGVTLVSSVSSVTRVFSFALDKSISATMPGILPPFVACCQAPQVWPLSMEREVSTFRFVPVGSVACQLISLVLTVPILDRSIGGEMREPDSVNLCL